jgi:hypothetical protein
MGAGKPDLSDAAHDCSKVNNFTQRKQDQPESNAQQSQLLRH